MTALTEASEAHMLPAPLILAAALSGAWRGAPPTVSPEELRQALPLLLASGAAPLFWWKIRDSELSGLPGADALLHEYRLSTIHAARREREVGQVFAALRAGGVEPILIKGWAVARLYPEAGLRPYTDIDLCVRPDQTEVARQVLKRPENKRYLVDLGHDEARGEDWENLYERSRLVKLGGTEVRTPCLEDHLRLLCVHLLKHGACRPLWLCDIAIIMESLPDDFDWDRCLGADPRRAHWVACAVGLARRLLGAEVKGGPPADVGARRPPAWLVSNTLRRWGTAAGMTLSHNRHRRRMAAYLRDPRGVLKDVARRWPDPTEATIRAGGALDGTCRLPFQLRDCVSRATGLLRGH